MVNLQAGCDGTDDAATTGRGSCVTTLGSGAACGKMFEEVARGRSHGRAAASERGGFLTELAPVPRSHSPTVPASGFCSQPRDPGPCNSDVPCSVPVRRAAAGSGPRSRGQGASRAVSLEAPENLVLSFPVSPGQGVLPCFSQGRPADALRLNPSTLTLPRPPS